MTKRALISVSDKTGIVDFSQELAKNGYSILSTGGTASLLREHGLEVTDVSDFTGAPELFNGRVKTLHPTVHGGLLFRRDSEDHIAQAKDNNIEPIDMVVVNLYPFEKTAADPTKTREELIEQIDIGGPSMLRSAAKNNASVTVICDIDDYEIVLDQIKQHGDTTAELRSELATKVFLRTAAYDAAITEALSDGANTGMILTNKTEMRYGENPHQWGAFYEQYGMPCGWKVLQEEKQMSYLNILDADGAWNLVQEYDTPTAACIKHANPSGIGSNDDIAEAFQMSYDADRLSAFGVIVSMNRECTKEVIEKIIDQKIFVEIIIAPSYEKEALELVAKKKKIRVIEYSNYTPEHRSVRTMLGGVLVQDLDTHVVKKEDLEVATDIKPTDAQLDDLLFAWKAVKNAKSNAIVFAKNLVTVGIGCGQTSRVDSTIIAARRAGERAQGAVMASDAFFPFADSIEEAAKHGIAAIIQPGGSIRDEEVIAKANELGIPMVFTATRGFKH